MLLNITGASFLAFLVAAVAVYYILPRRARWLALLAASAVFYLSYSATAAMYLAATVTATYLFSLPLGALASVKSVADTKEERARLKRRNLRARRAILAAALIINFSTLAVFKYSGFIASCVNNIIGTGITPPSLLLPLGISFYIFQSSGYLIDVYRGKYPPQRNIAKYALFIAYFPQMVQGPINRYDAMSESLFGGNGFDADNIRHGIQRMIFGILKKALIADALAPAVAAVYSNYSAYPGVVVFLAAALYCVQLYCDFSGGIDLLCGASELFGVKMAENFRRPYLSTSLDEFWRRWHISLGEWMKDYLFYPLTLSKCFGRLAKRARRRLPSDIAKRITPCIATVAVFLAVGIWQGPGWANIAYGLWNGFWMSLGFMWIPMRSRLEQHVPLLKNRPLMAVIGVIRTDILIIFGRYFSNSPSLRGALEMLKRTFTAPGLRSVSVELFRGLGLTPRIALQVATACAVLLVISLAGERGHDPVKWLNTRRAPIQFAVLFVSLALVVFCVYGNGDYTPIAYVYENV